MTRRLLFLAPALCAGGLLEHACECESEAACQHEESCPDDPCASFVRRSETRPAASPALELPWVPIFLAEREPELAHRSWDPSCAGPPPRLRPNLPYAESDRPLRL